MIMLWLSGLTLLRPAARHGQCICCASVPSLQETLTDKHDVSKGRPMIQWYPGHIAKAERLMSEVLSMVDVVVELRDARVPSATAHPSLPEWVGKRGHVLVLNRIDSVPQRVRCPRRRVLLTRHGN